MNPQLISFAAHMSCHLVVAVFLSIIFWFLFKSWKPVLICLIASFYTDADHLLEYFLAHGFEFDFQSMITGKYFIDVNKRYVLLHSYESVLIAFGLVVFHQIKWISALAYSAGLLGHLMVDQFSYPLKPLAYSLIYRAYYHFTPEAFGS